MGLGYTWVLTGIALVRELLGNGTILGLQVLGESYQPILFFVLPPGGFVLFALFISLNFFIKGRLKAPSAETPDIDSNTGGAHCGAAGEGQS
jgi:electron transport complex protein RnfE